MQNTIEPQAIEKMGRRIADCIDHIAFTKNGKEETTPIWKRIVEGNRIQLYAYFDDTVVGTVDNVRLIDKEGDVFARAPQSVMKPTENSLLVAFRYRIVEGVVAWEA